VAADEAGKAAEAKIWEASVSQIWDCFPGFCEMPRDLKEGLNAPFLGLISNILNTQPLLVPSVLRGLSQLVSSTQRLLASSTAPEELRKQFGVDQDKAKENMAYLKTLAKDMTSVLLNIFSKLPREQRGMVGDVIAAWTGIMTEKVSEDWDRTSAGPKLMINRISSASTPPSPPIFLKTLPARLRPLRAPRPSPTRCSTS
jgi:ribosomal RNA-processing protein 12